MLAGFSVFEARLSISSITDGSEAVSLVAFIRQGR
jgi:hypothetical protein